MNKYINNKVKRNDFIEFGSSISARNGSIRIVADHPHYTYTSIHIDEEPTEEDIDFINKYTSINNLQTQKIK